MKQVSQIQTLDPTQADLPMKKDRYSSVTHGCIGNGTATLFAALDVLDGQVTGHCIHRYRHRNSPASSTLEAAVPAGKLICAIDNHYNYPQTSQSPQVAAASYALDAAFYPPLHLRVHAVESYLANLTRRQLKRGVFRSTVEAKIPIKQCFAEADADPRSFGWTKVPDKIVAALKRGH